jgi:hypothetical protein
MSPICANTELAKDADARAITNSNIRFIFGFLLGRLPASESDSAARA